MQRTRTTPKRLDVFAAPRHELSALAFGYQTTRVQLHKLTKHKQHKVQAAVNSYVNHGQVKPPWSGTLGFDALGLHPLPAGCQDAIVEQAVHF